MMVGAYNNQSPYYSMPPQYEQYPQQPRMDFSQYPQEVHDPRQQMYHQPPKYSADIYNPMHKDAHNYPMQPELHPYDQRQYQFPILRSEPVPSSSEVKYPPYSIESETAKPGPQTSFGYPAFAQPLYSGFYSDPLYCNNLLIIAELNGSGEVGEKTTSNNEPEDKKEFKNEAYYGQAFSQGFGIGDFTKTEEKPNELKGIVL